MQPLLISEIGPRLERGRLTPVENDMSRPTQKWFVTYRAKGRPKDDSRTSETFKKKADAKACASKLRDQNGDITVGTLNPHPPKRFIGSRQIVNWLREDEPL